MSNRGVCVWGGNRAGFGAAFWISAAKHLVRAHRAQHRWRRLEGRLGAAEVAHQLRKVAGAELLARGSGGTEEVLHVDGSGYGGGRAREQHEGTAGEHRCLRCEKMAKQPCTRIQSFDRDLQSLFLLLSIFLYYDQDV